MSPNGRLKQTLMLSIEQALGRYSPSLMSADGKRQAVVAMILQDRPQGPEMLFIQRAKSVLDPWSGQVAFPGGGFEDGDPSLTAVAIRETWEEIGVCLHPALQIGRLDDQQGRHRHRLLNLRVACMVFRLETNPHLVPNEEVGDIFWIPLTMLRDPMRRIPHRTRFRATPYPAIHLGHARHGEKRILWGMTYRFVQDLLRITAV